MRISKNNRYKAGRYLLLELTGNKDAVHRECCLPFASYKVKPSATAGSHNGAPLRGIQDGEKWEAFYSLDTSPTAKVYIQQQFQ